VTVSLASSSNASFRWWRDAPSSAKRALLAAGLGWMLDSFDVMLYAMVGAALINDPTLLLLDEPTTGLDPQARHLLWDRLYRLKQRGVTLVLTTHYMDEAEQLCDRLVVMDKAKIVAEGSPRALIEQYSTREVTELRFAPGEAESLDGRLDGVAERVEHLPDRVLLYADDGEAAAVAVHERGLRPESVLVRRSSLEDVFLRLTGRSLID
jgi:lipooligosaccharide transport system ATP-binding protein